LPSTGTWTLTRLPGTIQTTGTGVSTTISDLIPGVYNFTVTNSVGCVSTASGNVIIAAQPPTPAAPVIVSVTQPTCVIPSGTVQLNGLPSTGTWTITRFPDMITRTGTGRTASVSELIVGTYSFSVTNSFGCQSPVSANAVVQPNPSAPVLIINNPDPVCQPATVNLTAPTITAGSTTGLIYTYWRNPEGTIPFNSPAAAGTGTYYIKGTDINLCTEIKQVSVVVREIPSANAGPDQTLEYQFSANLQADEHRPGETGAWSVFSGSGTFNNSSIPTTSVNNLSIGRNVLLWTVTNGVCPAAADSVIITVRDLTVPTLITPNNDGRNEFLIVSGIGSLGRAELIIFDRRGVRVYINKNYDNTWNGVDDNGDPLPDDTYFYVIDPGNGRTRTVFIVLRR
jgi:gliding motility-associated-like protein